MLVILGTAGFICCHETMRLEKDNEEWKLVQKNPFLYLAMKTKAYIINLRIRERILSKNNDNLKGIIA